MIDHGALADYLNKNKINENSIEFESKNSDEPSTNNKKLKIELFDTLFSLMDVLISGFIYGYAINVIFQTNWHIFDTLIVGLAIQSLIVFIDKKIKNNA